MLSIYPSISSIFPVFCPGVTRFLHHYPYVTPVCLTLTQMHLPQSLQLNRINGSVRFFHGFLSVLLLHSGHTSKLQFFHCFSIGFTRALRYNGPTSEPQFYLASFYPLPILSTVFPRVLINFPSVLLKFSIAFPFFSHCFTSYSLIFSIVCPIVYAINLSFHFINFSSVLPWCYSISPSLPLCYPSVSNAYPNAPSTISTVAPYKRFCSFLPWFSFRASTP